MNAILGWVRHNPWYKLASLALALTLWAYVVSSEPLVDETVRVPVVLEHLGPGLQIASFEPKDIPVTITARKNVVAAMRRGDQDMKLCGDLSGRKVGGPQRVSLNLINVPRGATATMWEPRFAEVVVDTVVTRTRNIDVVRRGYPAEGLIVDSISLAPPTTEVRTVSSVLARIDRIVAVVDVRGRGQTFADKVSLQAWDSKDVPVTGVTITPPETRATVSLRRVEQKVVVVEPRLTPPALGYRVTRITCTPQTIAISGEGDVLAEVVTVPTRPIDLTYVASSITRTVSLQPPEGVQLVGPKNVTVRVRVEPVPPELVRPPEPPAGEEPASPEPGGEADAEADGEPEAAEGAPDDDAVLGRDPTGGRATRPGL